MSLTIRYQNDVWRIVLCDKRNAVVSVDEVETRAQMLDIVLNLSVMLDHPI